MDWSTRIKIALRAAKGLVYLHEDCGESLEGDVSLSNLNEGIRPGHSILYSSYGSSDYDTTQYNEDMKKIRKMALASKDYVSSDQYSNPTSEYRLYPSGSSSEGQHTREMEMGQAKKDSRGFSAALDKEDAHFSV
ncbi:proline-rich receptor kinase PERK1 [Olea europaea subsp. europaea]|uniref:non-specific serine/threonine protein kinase n=1 Tax=Olea europaea subsp. europaea TaxID=158383 RepID=A0A8S0U4C4_OLEEU|nr:proline-rich receptor kinase PERK1 [Olea europaea subsp. europaea]